jgi:hypothetical protein
MSYNDLYKLLTPGLSRRERIRKYVVKIAVLSEDGNRSSFRHVVSSSIWNSGRLIKSINPVILRQNPLDYTYLMDLDDI